MSRIEQALEKAAQLRKTSTPRPQVERNRPDARVMPEKTEQSCFPAVATLLDVNNHFLVTVNEPNSPAAEEYRKLKSTLVKLTKDEKFSNTIMVASAVAGEGKSITSLNLAISLAQEYDHTVLLVDADLRRPSIHRYLGIDNKVGLADCLTNGVDLSDALVHTGIGKLVVLPAGREIQNPVELFSSQKMNDLLKELKHRYPDRYVIIDTPPILPFAEARHLSHMVDGIVFVVKEGLAAQSSVAEGIEALRGTNVLGIVYNEAAIGRMDDRYHYYRRYNSSETQPTGQ